MTFNPNFTSVTISGDQVFVEGSSLFDPSITIVDIRIALQQGDRVEIAHVDALIDGWTARFPVADDSSTNPQPDFDQHKDVLVFGIQTQVDPIQVVTWAEVKPIELKPPN